jgi:hypothetical protein
MIAYRQRALWTLDAQEQVRWTPVWIMHNIDRFCFNETGRQGSAANHFAPLSNRTRENSQAEADFAPPTPGKSTPHIVRGSFDLHLPM